MNIIYEKKFLNSICTSNHSKALFMELMLCSLHLGIQYEVLKVVSIQRDFCRSYLISAFGLGLADSVNLWLSCNPEAQGHCSASPPFLLPV